MKPLSIRASVTAWFVGLTMVLLTVFSLTLHSRLKDALHQGLDARLAAMADTLVAICEWDEDIGFVEFMASDELAQRLGAGQPGFGFEVWAWPKAELVFSPSEEDFFPPLPAFASAQPPQTRFDDFEGDDEADDSERRICTVLRRVPAIPETEDDVAKPAFDVVVRVSESLAPVEAELAQVARRIALLWGAALLVVIAFGFLLSRRFVRPLQELGRAAAAVHAGEKTPMPRRGSGDEVDQVAEILDRTFSSLEESSRRLARFTADAAHELRNPISVIRSAAEVALRHERSGPEYRQFLADVHDTSLRMGSIVEALLMLARTDAGLVRAAFRDVDLAEVVRDSARARPESAGRIRIDDGAPAIVRGEAGLLRVLVDNLLSNALRHADGKPVELAVGKEPDGVALRVRDHGPGVPSEARERVFERFYRVPGAEPDPSGAGLGLSIVAEVARVHAAACELQDAAPGTRVVVRFPPLTHATASAPASSSDGAAGSK